MTQYRVKHEAEYLSELQKQYGDSIRYWILYDHREGGAARSSNRGWWTFVGMLAFIKGQQEMFDRYKHRVLITEVVFDGEIPLEGKEPE